MSTHTTAPATVPTSQAGRPATSSPVTLDLPDGATPRQRAAMDEIQRIIHESGDPAGAAAQVAEIIAEKRARDAEAATLPPGHVPTAYALQRTPHRAFCADETHDRCEPTAHEGARVTVMIPGDTEGDGGSSPMTAVLHTDDNYVDPTPRVHLESGGDNLAILTPDGTDTLAAGLVAFADELRRLAQYARLPRLAQCPVFTWCQETGEHVTHASRTLALPAPDGDTYLGAYLLAEDGVDAAPICGFEANGAWANFDAAALRAEAAKIRAHCDELDKLADLLADEEAAHRAAGGNC
jgi:hypothetical protein